VLAGRSKAQILADTTSALERENYPRWLRSDMCYMMAKQQYLSDDDMSWHPHLMFFVSGDAREELGSPICLARR